jgi:hypothetical protein
MAQNELNPFSTEGPAVQSSICARCGKTAEIHLALLGGAFHLGETFCLSCGEALIHDLQKQDATFAAADRAAALLLGIAGAGIMPRPFLPGDASVDEMESGIIFWEGHGWSSDGPFAGA